MKIRLRKLYWLVLSFCFYLDVKKISLTLFYEKPQITQSYLVTHVKASRSIDYLTYDKFKIKLISENHYDV